MTADEKFNQIYQTIVNENEDVMEKARREAQAEKKHNLIIATVLIIINIALNYRIYKLTGDFSWRLEAVLFPISLAIYMIFKRSGKIKKYTKEFKTRVIGTMIKSFEEQLEFTPQDRINFKYI